MNYIYGALFFVLVSALVVLLSEGHRCYQPERARQERAVEHYRNDCRGLGGQPLTGSDFVLCFKQDALINVPPRKE